MLKGHVIKFIVVTAAFSMAVLLSVGNAHAATCPFAGSNTSLTKSQLPGTTFRLDILEDGGINELACWTITDASCSFLLAAGGSATSVEYWLPQPGSICTPQNGAGCSDVVQVSNDVANHCTIALLSATSENFGTSIGQLNTLPAAIGQGATVIFPAAATEPEVATLYVTVNGVGSPSRLVFQSNDGTIVGLPSDTGTFATASPTPAAPPAAYGLLALCLFLGVGLFVKRKDATG